MPTETRPNFFIVGAQKSGTSALTGWLQLHPRVFMSFPKEPGYLAFLEGGYPYPDGYGRPAPASKWVVSDREKYLDLFAEAPDDSAVIGEASTWYFSTPGVAARIKQYSPDAKILVILRNPADRAYSAWCHARREQLEPCDDFASALDMEQERGEVEFLLRYHRMGLYSEALKEYQSLFDPSRLLLLFYEDLVGDEAILWQKLCAFLDIDALEKVPQQRRLNQSGQPRSRVVQSMLKSYRFRRAVRAVVPFRGAAFIKEKLDNVNLKRFPALDEASRYRLRQFYREDIEKLSLLTDRNLDSWLA